MVLVTDGTKNNDDSTGQNKTDRNAALSIMLKAGIPNISDYIKNNNLDMPKNSALGEIAVRYLAYYDAGVTDEFIKPIVSVDENNNPIGRIKEGDVVICFNFRTDRCRQITTALTQRDFPECDMQKINLHYVTMTNYDNTFKDIKVVFEKEDVEMTLGEVLAKAGKKQIRISETEKYPHVTFFFSGGREKPFEGEKRIMIPSPKVATYDLKPKMSAYEVPEAIT